MYVDYLNSVMSKITLDRRHNTLKHRSAVKGKISDLLNVLIVCISHYS